METAQSVIKRFMKSLDDTSQQGIAAVDEAVRTASAGRFYNMRSVWEAFVQDAGGLLGTKADKKQIDNFLKKYCGIDLHNDDTGAISGFDAGGSKTAKTAESVIPDTMSDNTYFDSNYTAQGIKFVIDNPEWLNDRQKRMCRCIQRWWIKESLSVIKESYGLSLDEKGATVKEIHINFTKPAAISQGQWERTLAWTGGNSKTLTISINMDKQELYTRYNGVPNYNGIMAHMDNTENHEEYFDRTLTHELVHAVMDSTIKNAWSLPASIKEGMAELVHGIDDVRMNDIYHIFQTHTSGEWWTKLLTPEGTYSDANFSDTYAAGYVFLRYLAKQLAQSANQPAAKTFDKSGLTVTLGAKFTPNNFDLRKEAPLLRNVDARAAGHATNIYGDAEANVLYASNKGGTLRGFTGNDILYGGNSKDTFYYANGDGNDVIRNYGSGTDVVQVASGTVTTQISGYDLLLKVGKGAIRIVDGTTKNVLLKEGSKAVRTIKGYKKLPSSAVYNTSQTTVTLKNTAKETFDSRSYNTTIRTIDGKAAAAAVNIYGNSAANTIYAGKKGGTLRGFGGNDTLYGGAGTDTFYYVNGDGNDIIRNYESNKDIIQLGSGKISKTTASGNDVTFTIGKGSIKVIGGAGKTFRFKDAKNKITTKYVERPLPKGASYAANYTQVTLTSGFTGKIDARDYRSTIQNIDASKTSRSVTLYGNSKANRLVAGKGGSVLRGFGGNDTLVGGKGKDTFCFGKGDGNVTVDSFESNKDVIKLYDSNNFSDGVNVPSKTVRITTGTGKTMTIRNAYGKQINIQNASGRGYYILYDSFGRKVKTGAQNDNLYASSIRDIIYMNKNSGKDNIYNMQKNDILYLEGVANLKELYANVKNGILTLGINGSSMEARLMGWKAGNSFQLVYGNEAGNRQHTVMYDGKQVNVSR